MSRRRQQLEAELDRLVVGAPIEVRADRPANVCRLCTVAIEAGVGALCARCDLVLAVEQLPAEVER